MLEMSKRGDCELSAVTFCSPIGEILLRGCAKGVHTVDIQPKSHKEESVRPVGPSKLSHELQSCADWLQCYFLKPETICMLPMPAIHHPMMHNDSFKAHVLRTLLEQVGFGKTVSYKQLAEMTGSPKAARAVGSAMRQNPIPLIVPCHRVLRSSGQSGSYMGGKGDDIKLWLLTHEKKAIELKEAVSKTE